MTLARVFTFTFKFHTLVSYRPLSLSARRQRVGLVEELAGVFAQRDQRLAHVTDLPESRLGLPPWISSERWVYQALTWDYTYLITPIITTQELSSRD